MMHNDDEIEKLKLLSIYELRNKARTMGIAKPTTLSREKLISSMLEKQDCEKSKQIQDTVTSILDKSKETPPGISKLLEDWQDETGVSNNTTSLRATDADNLELKVTDGFIHIVPRGHGILINSIMKTYFVSIQHILAHKLRTGDFITARTDNSNAQEIIKVDHINFDTAKNARPYTKQTMGKVEFKFGDRVILTNTKPCDFVEYIAKNNKQINKAYKIALLIDQGEDCLDYLVEQGIDEVYNACVNQNIKKKIMFVLSSLFVAKRTSSKGKDVVLFIDNLNKLFKLYNLSMFDTSIIDITQLHQGAHTDLKMLFMQAKQIKDSGSLTIITFLREPSTELEKYAMDDFIDLSNVFETI